MNAKEKEVQMTTFEIFQNYVNERWNYDLIAKDWKEKEKR